MGSKVVTDEVVWTDAGRAALAKEQSFRAPLQRDVSRDELRARAEAGFAKLRPCWQRGLAKSDDVGRELIRYATDAWANGATPKKLSIDEAAGVMTLLGSQIDPFAAPLIELLLRDHGVGFVVCALVRAWSLVTDYDGEQSIKIMLRTVAPNAERDASWVNDASVSHGKATLADYLAARHRTGDARERAEIERAVADVWDTTPLWARPALAVAARDTKRAEAIARDIMDVKPSWYPHYVRGDLTRFILDVPLLERLGYFKWPRLQVTALEDHGTALLPVLEAAAQKLNSRLRPTMMEILDNIRGPRAAALVASLDGKAPVKAQVKAYFVRYPELAVASAKRGAVTAARGSAKARRGATKRP